MCDNEKQEIHSNALKTVWNQINKDIANGTPKTENEYAKMIADEVDKGVLEWMWENKDKLSAEKDENCQ